jgi:hypothetical protein
MACALILFARDASAADAPDCKPLRLLNSIKMTTNADRSRFYVPVAINGTPETLLLDTGGGMTQLTEKVAQDLKLEETSSIAMHDLYGHVSSKAALVPTFDLGIQRGQNLKIHIDPMPAISDGEGSEAAGVLSTDLFQEYDIDLDFAALRLNYFSQDHCEGRIVYWPERPLAIMPVDFRDGHLNLDVMLDGKKFHAVLDTGAPVTTTGVTDVVDAFDFERGSPELPVIEESKKNPNVKIYGHNFEQLSFGDITVLHPQIQLFPYIPPMHGIDLSRLRQVIIGINVLRQLHIYIAYGEKKLYITPAGTGESALLKPQTAAPP